MADFTGAPDDEFLAWYNAGLMDPYAIPPPLDIGGGMGSAAGGMPSAPLPPPPPPQKVEPGPTGPGPATGEVAPGVHLGLPTIADESQPESVTGGAIPTENPFEAPTLGAEAPPDVPYTPRTPGERVEEEFTPEGDPELTYSNPFDIPDAAAGGRALADLRQTDPERAARLETDKRVQAEQVARARKAEIDRQAMDDAERGLQARVEADKRTQTKMDEVTSDIERLSKMKVIPDRRGTFSVIIDALMGGIGGLVQGRTGSPVNQGLQIVRESLDRDVQAQKDEITSGMATANAKRGIVAEEFARHGDLWRAGEAARAAGYQRAINMLEAEMQNYDPQGTLVREYANSIAGLKQQQAQALMAARKNQLEEQTKLADYELKLLDIAKKRGALGGGGTTGLDEKRVAPAEQWAAMYGVEVPPQLKGVPVSGSQFKSIVGGGLDLTKKGQEAGTIERERGGLPLFDIGGKRLEFQPQGRTELVDKLRVKATAINEIVPLLDEAMKLRTGWSTDVGNSDEHQRLRAIKGKIDLAMKNAEDLGAIQGADKDLINAGIGTSDFTKLRDMRAGVAQARKNLIQSVRAGAVGLGMSKDEAAKIDVPNVYGTGLYEGSIDKTERFDPRNYTAPEKFSTEFK